MASAPATIPATIDVVSAFRGAMRRLASGVAIITARGEGGPVGMAATSVTSLTMEPPALLFCVNRAAGIHASLAIGGRIGVTLLSRHQSDVSAAFGGAVAREKRFEVGRWTTGHHDLPVLDEAQANLACRVDSIAAYGTHSIVVARVDNVLLSEAVAPLVYQDGAYS